MVKLETLNTILKAQGSIRDIDKSQKLVESLTEKLKLDTTNRLLMYNVDLIILIGRYVETKFSNQEEKFKVDLVYKVINAVYQNGIKDNEKAIILYIVENLFKGGFIKPLSTSEMCFHYVIDLLKKLI